MHPFFYNPNENPFDLNSSPHSLYLGETHKEALATLNYAVMERTGFVLLTGDEGTGKTAVVQKLIRDLDPAVMYFYLLAPSKFSAREFFLNLGLGLGFKGHYRSKGAFLAHFQPFLEKLKNYHHSVLLILDNAHNLSFDLLEEIRLLSNLETAEEKLITVILAGRTELNAKLKQVICRPLVQRIGLRYHIEPLDHKETGEYVALHLKGAGLNNGSKIFPKKALAAVYERSQGYPKMINILAGSAVRLAYTRGLKKITPAVVEQSFQDTTSGRASITQSKPREKAPVQAQIVVAPHRRRFKLAAGALAALIVAFGIGISTWDIAFDFARSIPADLRTSLNAVTRQGSLLFGIEGDTEPGQAPDSLKGKVIYRKVPAVVVDQTKADTAAVMATAQASGPHNSIWHTIIAEEGDTLIGLATKVYGWAGKNVLDLLQRNNPGIKDLGQIPRGQKILFPPLVELRDISAYTVHIASYQSFANAKEEFQALTQGGQEAFIIPVDAAQNGKFFRLMVGSFEDLQEAQAFATNIFDAGISPYANPIRMELKEAKNRLSQSSQRTQRP
jgi:type II secretory pathway predicted ATPase ExeA/phage tail protein X